MDSQLKKRKLVSSSSGSHSSKRKPIKKQSTYKDTVLSESKGSHDSEFVADIIEDDSDNASNDSSEQTSDYDELEDGDMDEEEEEDQTDLSRRLYYLSRLKLKDERAESVSGILKALEMARSVIFETNMEAKKIFEKSKNKVFDAKKVPPGSGAVQRLIEDDRMLLCLLSILHYQVMERQFSASEEKSVTVDDLGQILRNALIWFPRCIEANFLYGSFLRRYAVNDEGLKQAETYLYKAVAVGRNLKKEVDDVETKKKLSEENQEILDEEMIAYSNAEDALILLLCQQGRFQESIDYLVAKGYTWRLSRKVLCYDFANKSCTHEVIARENIKKPQYLVGVDDFLPQTMLDHLRHLFRPSSIYWREHAYDFVENSSRKVGYFSYLYPFKNRSAACSVEQVIDFIYDEAKLFFPELSEARYAEWWTHSRPHGSGHQLHFDSDETAIESGYEPNHPIMTLIVFLDGSVGGPSLVTNQVLGGPLATRGWLCHPVENRAVLFDANYLHGVIPGRGVTVYENAKRLTFMVGFWKNIRAKYRGVDNPGPAQPYPNTTLHVQSEGLMHITPSASSLKWHEEMTLREFKDVQPKVSLNIVQPIELECVWEPIESLDDISHDKISLKSSQPSYNSCFQGF